MNRPRGDSPVPAPPLAPDRPSHDSLPDFWGADSFWPKWAVRYWYNFTRVELALWPSDKNLPPSELGFRLWQVNDEHCVAAGPGGAGRGERAQR